MKLSIDHVLYGMTAAVIGGGALSLSAWSSPTTNHLETRFSQADYTAFDRNFEQDGRTCEVGMRDQGFCYGASHLEDRIIRGEPFPENMYPLAVEWRASLNMPQKPGSLKTVRIGQTLALMDRETRMVIDTMTLEATDYANASGGTRG